jgi:hypothetical protein
MTSLSLLFRPRVAGLVRDIRGKIRTKIGRRAVSRLLQYAIIGLAVVSWK